MAEKLGQEPKFEMSRDVRFRQLVENLIEQSGTFEIWTNPINPSEKMSVIDAIEKNELSIFIGNHARDKKLDAVYCLIAIYDELKRDKPNEDFIKETVEHLKEYL